MVNGFGKVRWGSNCGGATRKVNLTPLAGRLSRAFGGNHWSKLAANGNRNGEAAFSRFMVF